MLCVSCSSVESQACRQNWCYKGSVERPAEMSGTFASLCACLHSPFSSSLVVILLSFLLLLLFLTRTHTQFRFSLQASRISETVTLTLTYLLNIPSSRKFIRSQLDLEVSEQGRGGRKWELAFFPTFPFPERCIRVANHFNFKLP